MPVNMMRSQHLAENIVVIDGLSGSGKTLIAPLLSSFKKGELWLLDHLYEYLCTMDHYRIMSRQAAKTLMDLYVDIDLYNTMIGRNTNFRATDLSSVQKNLMTARYETRLAEKDGEPIVQKIRKTKPTLFLMTHYIFGISDLLFEGLGKRLKLFIIPVRHPLWLFESWYNGNYHKRIAADPRDFQQCVQEKGREIPWFAAGWERPYHAFNHFDQTVMVIKTLSEHISIQMKHLSTANRRKVMLVPFEQFATQPRPFMSSFEKKLADKPSTLTRTMMKHMNIPRKLDRSIFIQQKDKIIRNKNNDKGGQKYWDVFVQICKDYEAQYLPKEWRVF